MTMSSNGSSRDLFSSHQSQDILSTILDKNDIEWIWDDYRTPNEMILEVAGLSDVGCNDEF